MTAYERGTIWLAWAAFIVSTAAAIFACFQWREMHATTILMGKQLDEMKQSFVVDRAYVLGDRFDGWGKVSVKHGLIAKFWLNNFGKTPGILSSPIHIGCSYSPNGPLRLTVADNGTLPDGFVIPVDKPFDLSTMLDSTDEQISQAARGIGAIYCQAKIGYRDVRDGLHETEICFTYNFSAKDFYPCQDKESNHHN